MVEPRLVIRAIAALRLAFGAALAIKTEPFLRLMVRNETHSGSLVLFARALGVRDVALGLGALTATSDADLRRWSWVCLASDVADVAAGATGVRHVGRGKALAAAATPIPFVAAGLWALRRLAQTAES